MHEKIKDIQNGFWEAYKKFTKSLDIDQYTKDLEKIEKKYAYDPIMRKFCEDLSWSWSKVINGIKERAL